MRTGHLLSLLRAVGSREVVVQDEDGDVGKIVTVELPYEGPVTVRVDFSK